MKILLTAMAAMAETGGPSGRCRTLATAFKNAGMEVATCLAEDVNYKQISGIKNYFLEVPMPLGLPKVIAKRLFPIVQKLGISARKEVKSFDQVLYFTGNIDYKYLKHSVENIRKAIKDFKPDVVYSEFNVNKHNSTLQIYKSLGFTTIRAEKIDIGGGFYMDDYVERLEV